MRRTLLLIALSIGLASCGADRYRFEVSAPDDRDMVNEMVEFSLDQVEGVDDFAQRVLYDSHHNEIPSQITYDGKLIFQVNIEAGERENFTLRKGYSSDYATIACGDFYPKKMDNVSWDVAWENDKIGFRTYSTYYSKTGKKLYGYDIFSKRGNEPVLKELYALQTDPKIIADIARYKKEDPEQSVELSRRRSYHLDHGKGMDYYTVGPTLGCGTAALIVDGVTHYPTYFSNYEFLDNGPLRVTFKLEYDAVVMGGESVVEERIITLDAGTHFNKVEVRYRGLTKPAKAIIGLVLHDAAREYEITPNSIAYVDPMTSSGWQIYNGVLFDESMTGVVDLFDEEEKKAHGGAYGHIQAETTYTPNITLTYYMGAGWNGWGVANPEVWFDIVKSENARLF
ncbi:MAG: DUF4861 family protein [Rikenellaceae bacterium]